MFYKTFTFTKHLLSQNFLKHTFYSSKKYICPFINLLLSKGCHVN